MNVGIHLAGFGDRRRELKPPFYGDAVILGVVLLLVGFSIVMVYSTTGVVSQERYGDALFYVKRQSVAAVIGLLFMFLLSRVEIERVKSLSPFLLLVSIVLLLLTLLPGVGEGAGGAHRWIRLAFIRFQPGEIVKVLFVAFMAGFFARHEARLSTFSQGVVKPLGLVGVLSLLYLLQPDFGSAAVIAAVTLAMALAAGVRIRHLVASGLVLGGAAASLVFISPYRMQRILNFLSPWNDMSGKGYQLIQSLIAVGSGQVGGLGLGASQQKLFFLPAAHTDFIFAVVAEELGFVGATFLILVFLVFLWRGLKVAREFGNDTFCFSLAVGMTLLIAVPALLNVGVVTGLLPTKGLVLPFVGYGGSSLISCLIAVGILLALKRKYQLEFM